ncbi:MAG: efflux RND transporter periplasmic adaptor subunit [Candidatus Binatia bacterium]
MSGNRKSIAAKAPLVLAAILAASLWAPRSAKAVDDETHTRVRRAGFEVWVRLVGELEAARSTIISSEVRGDRGKIIYLVEDGERVKKGDVLVRLDPTPFEEEVRKYKAKVRENEVIVTAFEQALEWEKNQAVREVKTAEFDLRVAKLDLQKLEKGDGPLELARHEGAMSEAKRSYEEKAGYLADLEALEKRGYSNPTEITQAKAKLEEAQQAFNVAERQYESYRNYILPSLLETAQARVERAKMELEQTKKGVVFKVGKALAALRKAKREIENSQALLEGAKSELEKTIIRAPIPGLVVLKETHRGGQRRKPRVGDTVWQNQPILFLPDVSAMVVKTRVREVDLHKVGRGKPGSVRVDAYPEARLAGRVESIGVLAERKLETRGGEKYFNLTVSIQDEDARLRPGMTARVEILADEITNALVVPVHAVFEQDGRKFCYVEAGAIYELREVALGVQNEDVVEIQDGLSEGEFVSLIRPKADQIRKTTLLSLRGSGDARDGHR